MKVEGMVCKGCENRVKNALENIKGVHKVKANHETGLVTLALKEEVDLKILEEAITNLGFEVKAN